MVRQTTGKQDASGRQKMEDGIWRQTSERSFAAWNDAPAASKERHLLSGPCLAWVEGNLIAHPEQYSNAFRRFVMLSASRRAGETALGRQLSDADERKKDVRVRFMFFAAAGLAMVHAVSGDLKPALETMINGAEQTKIAAIRARKQSTSSPQIEPQTGSKVVMSTHRDPETGEPVITTIMELPPAKRVMPTDRDQRTERERVARLVQRQASLANARANQGDKRVALHLAAEAVRQSEALIVARKVADEPTGAQEALTALYRGLGTATLEPALEARPARGQPSLPCAAKYVFTSADLNLRRLDGATGRHETISLTAPLDGRLLAVDSTCSIAAVGIEDYAVKLMSLSGGKSRVIGVLHGHASDILSVAISPDAAYVATASLDATLRIWDARTGRRLATIGEHESAVSGVRFGPDGRTLLSWAADKTARVWSVPSGNMIAALDGHIGSVSDALFSLEGRRIMTVSVDGQARVWNATSGVLEATLLSERSSIALARFSHDASHAVVVTHEGDVETWSLSTVSRLGLRHGAGNDPAREVAFSPDGRWIIATTWTGRVQLLASDLNGDVVDLNGSAVPARHAGISADGRHVEVFGTDGVIRRWPLYAGHDDAVSDAIRIAGACLSSAERDELGIGLTAPAWCAKLEMPSSP